MKYWYERGCKHEEFPACQRDKDLWSRLIAIPYRSQGNRQLVYYEQGPEPIPFYGPFMAWGSGRDVAMGALAMGADARKAVEIACKYNVYCGMGFDVIEITQVPAPSEEVNFAGKSLVYGYKGVI